MECHKCRWAGKPPGERQAKCLACCAEHQRNPDATPTHAGRDFVYFDDMQGGEDFITAHRAADVTAPNGLDLDLPENKEETERRLRTFLTDLFSLSDDELLLLRHVYGGGKLTAFATAHGFSRQYVSKLVRRIATRKPVFRGVFSKDRLREDGTAGRFVQMQINFDLDAPAS